MWQEGTKLIRKHSPELGIGVVIGVDGPFIEVFFPDVMERMTLRPDPVSITPILLGEGDHVLVPGDAAQRVTRIKRVVGELAVLESGHSHPLDELWPVLERRGPLERMLAGELDDAQHVTNRADGLVLEELRRRGALASLLGGRVELFAHQLDTAMRAIEQDQVRWLLADEVGLGKTIVAHMITSAMLRMERIERVVLITPETLTVQWLGELYRKFHQVFVRVDEARMADVRAEIGAHVNPFEVYPLAVVSQELLDRDPMVLAALAATEPELVVIDEAHRMLGISCKQELLDMVSAAPHAMMLTATPFQLGEEGFVTLVDALGLPHQVSDSGRHIVKNVSAVTREDIPALPVRLPSYEAIEAPGRLSAEEPRVAWLAERLVAWKEAGEKALVFVNHPRDAKVLQELLARLTHLELFAFREDMDTSNRDIELSRFRLSASPALIASGAGSEGRNFQFCDRLVHFDLPDDPTVLEQRIGRLDRIGREQDIPIHVFTFDAPGGERARAYRELGVFDDASVGASPAMAILREFFVNPARDASQLDVVLARVREAMSRHDGQWLFPSSHQVEDSDDVFELLPDDLELLVERFCVDAAERVGMDVVEKDGLSVYFFEHGANVTADTIPGVEREARFLGTFDRQEAVEQQELDFFSNGHALVEGLLAELQDCPQGRAGATRLSRRRLAREFELEALLEGHYLLLAEAPRDGGALPLSLYAITDDGLAAVEIEGAALSMLRAVEHGKAIGKRDHRDHLNRFGAAILDSAPDTLDVTMAIWIEWVA